MGSWYKVTKRINGRLYDYWQRTERQGKSVKTFNKYIGPTTTLQKGQPISRWRTMSSATRYNAELDRTFHAAKVLNRQYEPMREAQASDAERHELMGTIPSYTAAKALITREGGYSKVETLAAENAYAAEQFANSAALTTTYIYEQATKRGIRINAWLLRFDAETDPVKRSGIVLEFMDTISPISSKPIPLKGPPPTEHERTVSEHRDYLANADYMPPPPPDPEPVPEYDKEEMRGIRAVLRAEKKEFDAAMKVQMAKVRKARSEGLRASSPSIPLWRRC